MPRPLDDAAEDVVVEVNDLVVAYPGITAVDGVSFAVARGRVTAFLGPNGAGKTTTLEVCEGLRRPTSGSVRVLGHDPATADAGQRARVGVMLQSGGVPSSARAVEFVRQVGSLHERPLDVGDLCERLGLTAIGRTPYRRMSGGQKQSLALAVALVGRPELVLLDEPTAGLDPAARIRTWELVEHLRSSGVSVVLSTHYLEEAQRLADDVLIVDRGRIVADGTLDELIGGSRDQVHLATNPAVDADALALALGPDVAVRAHGDGVVVSGAAAGELSARITTWCASQGVAITGLSGGRRTLEDVFFERTGRPMA